MRLTQSSDGATPNGSGFRIDSPRHAGRANKAADRGTGGPSKMLVPCEDTPSGGTAPGMDQGAESCDHRRATGAERELEQVRSQPFRSLDALSPAVGAGASCLQDLLPAASYRGSYFQRAPFQQIPRP
jgi:hypothetical protein